MHACYASVCAWHVPYALARTNRPRERRAVLNGEGDAPIKSMQSSTELTATVSLQTMSILDALDVALAGLESEEVHDRALAARQLTTLVEGVYGEDAAAVGSYVRESNALEMLLELVRVAARRQCLKRTAPWPCTPAVLTPPCCFADCRPRR